MRNLYITTVLPVTVTDDAPLQDVLDHGRERLGEILNGETGAPAGFTETVSEELPTVPAALLVERAA